MQVSSRSEVDAFIVMDVVEAARKLEEAGRHIIHMEVGQPSTGLSPRAAAVVGQAAQDHALGYTVSLGLPALRTKIAALYGEWYGLDLDPGRIIVTAGASGAFLLAFSALFDNGARVGLGLPGYPSYRQILKALGLQPVGFETRAQDGFQPTLDTLPDGLDGLIVASPSNPAGTIMGQPALSALIDHCQSNDIAFISDEIYHGLHYDSPSTSALQVSDDVYVINSFSKYFSLTGWRVGWMVVPDKHVRTVERLAQNMFICASHASQVAALAAMDDVAFCEENRARYAKNREVLCEGLKAAGLGNFAAPDGAFYVYVDISHLQIGSFELSERLLHDAGVAVTPGLDFDPERGKDFLRFSYAGSTADMHEGVNRLAKFLGNLA